MAALGLLVLWPLLLLVAAAIWWQDSRPVLFAQERVGRHGVPFRMLKFRTMRARSHGPLITAAGDPRITPIGRLLRRSKLDELPQLFNVLKGEMAVVGPRPEVARYVARYSTAERCVLDLLPGITDPASLAFLDEEHVLAQAADPELTYVGAIMPEKIRLNLAYATRATALTDIRVVLATLSGILTRYGATARPNAVSRSASAK